MVNHGYRILFVLTPAMHPQSGGVQMSTWKLGRYFAWLGHELGVFSFAQAGHADCEFGRIWPGTELGGERSLGNLCALENVLNSFRPHVVINQMPYEHDIGGLLKSRKDFLLLGCLRNTLFSVKGNLKAYVDRTAPAFIRGLSDSSTVQKGFLALHRRRHSRDLRRILDTYDYFVMFGPPNLEELEYFVPGFDREKVRLIPNSIPHVAESPPPKQKRLLWLGRVAHEQKQAGLIPEVWRRVCERLPDWSLDVVGDGPALLEVKGRVSDLQLPRVEFHGRQVPDDYYSQASIFFMTSAFEGFPNTLVEAQSYGAVPVVFDSYPVASWIVENGRSGILVEPFDVDGMAERIVELATGGLLSQLTEGALESARRFRIDHVGAMWQEFFESAVPKQTAHSPV